MLFISESREALVIILGELEASSYFWGFRESCQNVKNSIKSHLKGKSSILFDFLKFILLPLLYIPYRRQPLFFQSMEKTTFLFVDALFSVHHKRTWGG